MLFYPYIKPMPTVYFDGKLASRNFIELKNRSRHGTLKNKLVDWKEYKRHVLTLRWKWRLLIYTNVTINKLYMYVIAII